MMQEVSDDTVVTQAAIVDQLQDAAQTNVTQGQLGGVSSPISSASSISPPSQLPPSLTSPIAAPSQLPPTAIGSPLPPRVPGAQGFPGGVGVSPPPPMGGFVPNPGAVTGTPSKYPTIAGSSPQSPQQMSTSVYTPSAIPNMPAGMSQSFPSPSQPSLQASPQQQPPAPQPPYSQFSPAQQQTPTGYSTGGPSAQQSINISPPGALQSPHEASASIDLGGDTLGPVYPMPEETEKPGLFGWFSGSNFMNKVVEKTKTLSENVITTLDPGMKEVIFTGSDGIQVMVASQKEVKVGAVRQAFYEVFSRAVVDGMDSQPPGIAPQPVGYQAAMKGCEERIEQLRRSGHVDDRQVLIAVENFIVEILPDRWYDIGCILLKDPANNIELKTFTTATPIPSEYVQQAQDETPSTYDLRWSGLSVTIGQIINRNLPYVNHADWHSHFTGVSRRELIYMGVKVLAGMYKQRLPPQQGVH